EIISSVSRITQNSSEKRKFLVKDSINEVISIIGGRVNDSYITIKQDVEEPVELFGVQSLLSQVILNILVNAIDELNIRYVEQKVISILTFRENGFLMIKIKDNAGGISDETRCNIFSQLYTNKEDIEKSGMGLYLCVKTLEDNFNGYIFCENKVDEYGLGACFTIKIPIRINKCLQDTTNV
ncbi:MAG: HAMP domain-containing sensor histidine kinase, partial [Arcobacteraceae bacterium]